MSLKRIRYAIRDRNLVRGELIIAVGIALMSSWAPNRANAAATFVDLTAKEYKGPDDDLPGLTLSKFGVNCEEPGHQIPGQVPWITFDIHAERQDRGKPNYGVKRFSIHFRIKNRKGEVVHDEDFVYKGHSSGGQWPYRGVIVAGNIDVHCDKAAAHLGKYVDLSYATVEYWLTKIDWMPKP